jgi:hypothetical protein
MALGFKIRPKKAGALRSNAIEIGDVLLDLTEPRHALERSAVPPGYGGRALHVVGVGDPGIVCVTFEHEGFCRASKTHSADQGDEEPPSRHRRFDLPRSVERTNTHLSFVAGNWTPSLPGAAGTVDWQSPFCERRSGRLFDAI